MKPQIPYATPTEELLRQLMTATNPVKRWSVRQIIGERIDRHEQRHMEKYLTSNGERQ